MFDQKAYAFHKWQLDVERGEEQMDPALVYRIRRLQIDPNEEPEIQEDAGVAGGRQQKSKVGDRGDKKASREKQ